MHISGDIMPLRKKRIGQLTKNLIYKKQVEERLRRQKKLEGEKRSLNLDHSYSEKQELDAKIPNSTCQEAESKYISNTSTSVEHVNERLIHKPCFNPLRRYKIATQCCRLRTCKNYLLSRRCKTQTLNAEEPNGRNEIQPEVVSCAISPVEHSNEAPDSGIKNSKFPKTESQDTILDATGANFTEALSKTGALEKDISITHEEQCHFKGISLSETKFENLKKLLTVSALPRRWYFVNRSTILLYQLSDTDDLTVQKCVKINESFEVTLRVHRKILPGHHSLNQVFPNLTGNAEECVSQLCLFLRAINSYNVCCGNAEKKFINEFSCMLQAGIARQDCYLEQDFQEKIQDGSIIETTVRSSSCELLVTYLRCSSCSKVRRSFRKRVSGINPKNKAIKHLPLKYMNKNMLENRLRLRNKENKQLKAKNKRLKEKMKIFAQGQEHSNVFE